MSEISYLIEARAVSVNHRRKQQDLIFPRLHQLHQNYIKINIYY